MSKKKVWISLFVTIALLFSLSAVATADAPINTEEMILPTDLNPYEYGSAPDGLYVFLYHGTTPYFDIDINTSECVVDRLYVYDSALDAVTEISDAAVTAYTATKDALYYITQAQTLYATDYTGQNQEQLYVCEQGVMKGLSSYLNTLYFIENDSEVIYFDTITKQSQSTLQFDDLAWVHLLGETELILATTEDAYFLHNFLTKETVAISQIEAINRINADVLHWNNTTEPDVSVMAAYDSSALTQANDISFPLAEYPTAFSDPPYGENFWHAPPISWFHKNNQEGCNGGDNCKSYSGTDECEGFARYAHDVYMHKVNNNIGYEAWKTENHCYDGDVIFDKYVPNVISFFNTLNTGAYVRYKTNSYYHSIVFVSRDTNGIWVYECNQKYQEPISVYGCGVHFQYYTYAVIAGNYPYVDHYVNHTFEVAPTYNNVLYHRVMCTSCDGYVQHTPSGATYSAYSSTQHKVSYTCCNGVAYQNHTYSNNMCTKCGRYDYGLAQFDSRGKDPVMFKNSLR